MTPAHVISEIDGLLADLEERAAAGRRIEDVNTRLTALARECGLGGRAATGSAIEQLRAELATRPGTKQRLVAWLESPVPKLRSWAGSFVEALFEPADAIERLTRAVRGEHDADTLAWLCLS